MATMTASQLAERLAGTEIWQKILTDCGTTAEQFNREIVWGQITMAIRTARRQSIVRSRVGWYGGEMVEVLVDRDAGPWVRTSAGIIQIRWEEIV